MKAAYENAKAGEPGLGGYDRWFAQQPNNAALAAIGIYTDRVPAFRELLREDERRPAGVLRARARDGRLAEAMRATRSSTRSRARAAAASMSAQRRRRRILAAD